MKKNINAINRLEQALMFWEDLNFTRSILAEPGDNLHGKPSIPMERVYKSGQKLRKELLQAYKKEDIFDVTEFIGESKEYNKFYRAFWMLPACLFLWSRLSRRIYHLSNSLQTILEWTSLEGVKWSDIEWPFDSFAITLERPITDINGREYDCLMFCKTDIRYGAQSNETTSQMLFLLFSNNLENYTPLSKIEKASFQKAACNSQGKKAMKIVDRIVARSPAADETTPLRGFTLNVAECDSSLVTTKAVEYLTVGQRARFKEEEFADMDKAFRIIVGLALYFKSLPPNESSFKVSRASEHVSIKNLNVITTEAEVCSVSTGSNATFRDRDFINAVNDHFRQLGHYGLPVHWRMGYWRRKPHEGSNPEAKKTVRVSPALVNEHLLKELLSEGLPIGSKRNL